MTYYLCLALPQEAIPQMRHSFDQRIFFTDVSTAPIGEAARGKNTKWSAFFLETKHGSAILIGKASARKTPNNDQSDLFVKGIQSLMASHICPSAAFMYHWMHGYITEENISVKREEKVKALNMSELISTLEEDVRYMVSQ